MSVGIQKENENAEWIEMIKIYYINPIFTFTMHILKFNVH